MDPSTNITLELIKAGAGGLVLIAIVLFLKYMRGERIKSDTIFTASMQLIADQRTAHLESDLRVAEVTAEASKSVTQINAAAYAQMAEAVGGLANEIKKLNEGHAVHDAKMVQALSDMRDVKIDRRLGSGRRKTNGEGSHNAETTPGN